MLHADWYDPELNPKLAAFAAHYGTVILPTKLRVPRHKGRVERGIDFVQHALKGRSFPSLGAANTFLTEWEKNVADTRIHGTTRRHVGEHFFAVEKPALQPLPASIFPSYTEGKRRVHLDGHVEFDKAYYSVPPEYTGREVWVRGESRLIRIYSLKMEEITGHPRVGPGRTHTDDAHIHPLKRRLADRGTVYLFERCQDLGPNTGAWALAMCQHRGLEGIGISGGEGVEHLALQYSAKGKPVISLDLNLGASQHDGTGGASRLFHRALAKPSDFFQVLPGAAPADLLDRTRTRDGSADTRASRSLTRRSRGCGEKQRSSREGCLPSWLPQVRRVQPAWYAGPQRNRGTTQKLHDELCRVTSGPNDGFPSVAAPVTERYSA